MRLLHTMLPISNPERTLDFYLNALSMRLLRKNDYPEEKFTRYFVGYDDESDGAVLEFTHEWEIPPSAALKFGHIGIEVDDAALACERAVQNFGVVLAPPHKPRSTVLAFVADPDGHVIEFVERRHADSCG